MCKGNWFNFYLVILWLIFGYLWLFFSLNGNVVYVFDKVFVVYVFMWDDIILYKLCILGDIYVKWNLNVCY